MKEDKIEKTQKCFEVIWKCDDNSLTWYYTYKMVVVTQYNGIYIKIDNREIKNTLWSYEGRLLQKKNE